MFTRMYMFTCRYVGIDSIGSRDLYTYEYMLVTIRSLNFGVTHRVLLHWLSPIVTQCDSHLYCTQ